MEKWEKAIQLMGELETAFNDTCKMSADDTRLKKRVSHSVAKQEVILERRLIEQKLDEDRPGRVIVSKKKTLEAASAYPGKKVAVLNFACPTYPGGGHVGRTHTQEEDLCRQSTLYSCISTAKCMEQFYEPHKALDDNYNADMIYTPDVTVFKTHDTVPELMPEDRWFNVDVITMAAPNVSSIRKPLPTFNDKEFLDLFTERFKHIVLQAVAHDVDVLILGAFGCGTFGNDPATVAVAAGRVMESFRKNFDAVEFAIYEKGYPQRYRMFNLVLDRYVNEL